MDQSPKIQNSGPVSVPERDFFWEKYVDRAMSKLKHFIRPQCLQKVDVGFCGDVNMSMGIAEIQINRTTPNPTCVCMWCGSKLETSECETCYSLIVGHKKGWCYFVIDHFQGKDYSVVFTVDGSFDHEKMCADVEKPIENDFIGPYVNRVSNFLTRPMGLKRKKC